MKLIDVCEKIEVKKVKVLEKEPGVGGLTFEMPDNLKAAPERYATYTSESYPDKLLLINPYDVFNFEATPKRSMLIADKRNLYAVIDLGEELKTMPYMDWVSKNNEAMDGIIIKPTRPRIFTGE